MKKITALTLAAMLALTVCGCRQAAPEQKEEPQVETVVPEQEPSSKTSVSIGSDIAYDSLFPQHEPYGTGVGAMPGRVVWAHDPDCVEWDGNGWWWEVEHFDEAPYIRMGMVSRLRIWAFTSIGITQRKDCTAGTWERKKALS